MIGITREPDTRSAFAAEARNHDGLSAAMIADFGLIHLGVSSWWEAERLLSRPHPGKADVRPCKPEPRLSASPSRSPNRQLNLKAAIHFRSMNGFRARHRNQGRCVRRCRTQQGKANATPRGKEEVNA